MKKLFIGLSWKRLVLICVLSAILVLVFATAVSATEPTLADDIETAFSGAGDQLNEVILKVVPIALPVMIGMVAVFLAVKLVRRIAR